MPCQVDSIQYGEFRFSNFVNSTAEFTAVTNDDMATIPRWRVQIEVSTILTTEIADLDPVGGGVDFHMDKLKTILQKPGLQLRFTYRGMGTNTLWTAEADLAYRAMPELIAWEPLIANNAVRVIWRCTAYVPTCPEVNMIVAVPADVLPPAEIQMITEKLIQTIEEQDVTILPEGPMQITVIGTLSFAGQFNSNAVITPKKLQALYSYLFDHTTIPRFHRTYKLRFNKDHRSLSYVITDTEIASDNALFPYMVKCHVEHKIGSSLLSDDAFAGAGFTTWLNRFTGRFTVAPHAPKAYAWMAFLVYLYNRQGRVPQSLAGVGNGDNAKDETDQKANGNKSEKVIKPYQVPLSLEITEVITSREVSIDMTYMVKSSLDKLFKHTGMFFPVDTKWQGIQLGKVPTTNINGVEVPIPPVLDQAPPNGLQGGPQPEPLRVQWRLYSTQLRTHQNPLGHAKVGLPAYSLVFDPCRTYATRFAQNRRQSHLYQDDELAFPEQIDPESENTLNDVSKILGILQAGGNGSTNNQSVYLNSVTPDNTWLAYNQEFDLIEDSNNTYLPSIDNINPSTWGPPSSGNSNAKRSQVGFRINGGSVSIGKTPYANHTVQPIGAPLYKVRMTGYAIRVGLSIPSPSLVGVYAEGAGQPELIPASRTGQSKWKHKLLNTSADMPVYLAMWDVTYALKGDPSSDNIRFESLSRAEFA